MSRPMMRIHREWRNDINMSAEYTSSKRCISPVLTELDRLFFCKGYHQGWEPSELMMHKVPQESFTTGLLIASERNVANSPGSHPFLEAMDLPEMLAPMIFLVAGHLRGAWTDRDTNDIFSHCFLIFYFLDFKFPNFVCLSELHPLIWFFCKNSFRKMKNIQKTTQNALAPSIFIVLSIVLKLGTPLLHAQAQNTLLQNF